MATGRGTDSAMAVWVCVSVLSQTPTGFNTAGTGWSVSMKCVQLNWTHGLGPSQLTYQNSTSLSLCFICV